MKINLPAQVSMIISVLESNGYEAYAVGGCVRDSLLGLSPLDWDICTSALPSGIIRCFPDLKVVETGKAYGTVTLIVDNLSFEVTTFRTDGTYTDSRHPDEVVFVTNLKDDLARRDFTINAMAYNNKSGLVDYFEGRKDLEKGLIRCVGNPKERFSEDALRMMRALRFSAVYGLKIDDSTSDTIHAQKKKLTQIAAERIRVELNKLICGKHCKKVLLNFPDVIAVVLPEILPMVGFEQHNSHHQFDVWKHSVTSIEAIPPIESLRLAMLLHDIGKPHTFTRDQKGIGHFYGHAEVSERLAFKVLSRLKYDRGTTERILRLIKHHGTPVMPTDKNIKRWLNKLGEQELKLLLQVKRADRLGKGTVVSKSHKEELDDILKCEQKIDELIEQGACFNRKDLAVDGSDLIAMGMEPGPKVGEVLEELLKLVMDGAENDRNTLLERVSRML